MRPYGNTAMLTGSGYSKFIGQYTATTPGALTYPVGTAEADLAVVFCNISSSISGWSLSETQGSLKMISKRLTQADIDTPASVSSGAQFALHIYRGAGRATKRTGVSQAAIPPLVIPGFNRQSGSSLIVAHYQSVNNSAGNVPSGWTRRANNIGDVGFTTLTTADLLTPVDYPNGDNIVISNSGPSAAGDGLVAELF